MDAHRNDAINKKPGSGPARHASGTFKNVTLLSKKGCACVPGYRASNFKIAVLQCALPYPGEGAENYSLRLLRLEQQFIALFGVTLKSKGGTPLHGMNSLHDWTRTAHAKSGTVIPMNLRKREHC